MILIGIAFNLQIGRRSEGLGEKGEGINKYKLAVTEQSW